jgi:hypothetical protein
MGKITQTAIALILTFFVVGNFMFALYSISTDPAKANFSTYAQKNDKTMQIMTQNNMTLNNTNSTILNFQNIADNIVTTISEQQKNFISDLSVPEKILNAFGLAASLALNILILFVAVIVEGVNFVFAVASGLATLPTPWNSLAIFGVLGTVLITVYLVFKLVSAYIKWDI